jgi:glycosyltransferase involved in cell wall biosynthesis
VRVLPFAPSLRKAVRHSSALLATNIETARLLSTAGASSVRILNDNALRRGAYPDQPERFATPHQINLLWAGKLIRWKGLDLALAAMKRLPPNAKVHLTVAGDGPLRREFESSAERLGLRDIVSFRGRIPWEEMAQEFLAADAFLFTSIRDSFGSVVLEAASYGLPSIALDIGGVGTFLPASAAIKVRPSNVEGTVLAIAEAILRLRDDAALRLEMGSASRRFAESMLWDKHAATMWQIYQEAAGLSEPPADWGRDENLNNPQ